nr:ATP synthase F0 subunit 8 [Menesia sulphurata]
MPQMAPLNWLILFMFFVIIFITFNIINYYAFCYLPKNEKKSKTLINFNWKW